MATTERPMNALLEKTQNPVNPRKNRNFPVVSYFGRMKTALEVVAATTTQWVDRYEWERRFGHRVRVKAITQDNIPFVQVLRNTGEEIEDIMAFMIPYPSSPRWEDRLAQIQEFCEGADFILQNFLPDVPGSSRLKDAQEPRAWISECGLDPEADSNLRDCLLTNSQLYTALKEKRFRMDVGCEAVSNTRRIYINNPNGVSILALLRTAPASQVYGLRILFANYLNPNPVPELGVIEPDWWRSCFIIACTLPFLAIGTRDREDTRIFSSDNSLRARYDIGFLNLKYWISSRVQQESSCVPDNAVLHVAVYSLMITGHSERYSTTVCLDDDFFDDEPRLANAEEVEQVDLEGIPDPIIFQFVSSNVQSSRAYALLALAKQLEKIVEYHGNIQECMKRSFEFYTSIPDVHAIKARKAVEDWRKNFPVNLNKLIHFNSKLAEKVSYFLTDDIRVGSDDIPYGELWRGLQAEPEALKSLRAVKGFSSKLRDIGTGLEHLKDAFDDVRRESKNLYAVEQQSRDKIIEQITIAAFVLAIMNLIAQVYAGKPGNDDKDDWPGYITMVAIYTVICIPGIVWSVCQYMSRKNKVG